MLTGHENPNSYDLRLGSQLLVYAKARKTMLAIIQGDGVEAPGEPLDMRTEEAVFPLVIPDSGLVLYPGVLYLGSTVEKTYTPFHVPCIEGKSSVGRLGIQVHLTAGFGDVGFDGDWTLEIQVTHPVRVYAGVRFCQISYQSPEGQSWPYAGRYQGQRGPKPSGMWRDFDLKNPGVGRSAV